jgi:hypothetical protein
MTVRTHIQDEWNRHVLRQFPRECVGLEIAGASLTSCDTYLAGCISYFIESGALDPERRSVVISVSADIERALPHLTGEAHTHFSSLLAMGRRLVPREDAC